MTRNGHAAASVGFFSQAVPTMLAMAPPLHKTPAREFVLKKIVRHANGTYTLVSAGRLVRPLQAQAQCSERLSPLSNLSRDPGEMMEGFFGQHPDVWPVLRTVDAYEYGRRYAETARLDGRQCRTLSQSLQRALLIRAGVVSGVEGHQIESEAA